MTKLILTQERDSIKRIKELVDNLNLLEEITPQVDLSSVNYVTPLTILPIAAKLKKLSETKTINIHCSELLKQVKFPTGTGNPIFSDNMSEMPICHLSLSGDNRNQKDMIDDISTEYSHFILDYLKNNQEVSANYQSSVSYFVSELCDNVVEHAHADNFWIFSRFWQSRGELEICILDDGLGIKGAYDRIGIGTSSHLDALSQAVDGRSSKKSTPNERGYGIGTNINLFCSGELRGEFTLISGNACYHKSSQISESMIGTIPINWRGTTISARLIRPESRVDILKYISC